MKKPEIDYNKIGSDITEKCNSMLSIINEHSISDTSDAVKEIVEIAVETYSYNVSDLWKKEHADSDIHRKIKFTDLKSGYLKLMKNWVRQNPLNSNLPQYPQDSSESYSEYSTQINKKTAVVGFTGTATICIAYAKGWWVFGNPIVALAAELITLGVLYKTVESKKTAKFKEIEHEMDMIRQKQNSYKLELTNYLIKTTKEWIEAAEQHSDSIIETF